jgi:opacity protein-like surface antigen
MKKILIAALLSAQVAAPAAAADLVTEARSEGGRTGSFAGARLRISLDGVSRDRVRAGVTLAPTRHELQGGAVRMRVGEGLEFGVTDRRGPQLSLAGRPVRELAQAGRGPDGQRQNVSTLGWVAIGVGVVVVGVVAYGLWLTHELSEPHD